MLACGVCALAGPHLPFQYSKRGIVSIANSGPNTNSRSMCVSVRGVCISMGVAAVAAWSELGPLNLRECLHPKTQCVAFRMFRLASASLRHWPTALRFPPGAIFLHRPHISRSHTSCPSHPQAVLRQSSYAIDLTLLPAPVFSLPTRSQFFVTYTAHAHRTHHDTFFDPTVSLPTRSQFFVTYKAHVHQTHHDTFLYSFFPSPPAASCLSATDKAHVHLNGNGRSRSSTAPPSSIGPIPSRPCFALPARSQFFVTYKAHAHLNGKYTIFGQVIDGMEVLDRMEKVPTDEKVGKVLIHVCWGSTNAAVFGQVIDEMEVLDRMGED